MSETISVATSMKRVQVYLGKSGPTSEPIIRGLTVIPVFISLKQRLLLCICFTTA